MSIELQNAEPLLTDEAIQYAFVADADLSSVGGGSLVVDY